MTVPSLLAPLETERLFMRGATLADAAELARFYRENEEHLGGVEAKRPPHFFTEAFWLERLPAFEAEWRAERGRRFLLFKKGEPGRVIGTLSILDIARGGAQHAYAGFALDGRETGNGYMTEAFRRLCRYAFEELNLHRLMGNYLPENRAAEVITRKLGFQIDGYAQDYFYVGGQWRGMVLSSLLNRAWQPPAAP